MRTRLVLGLLGAAVVVGLAQYLEATIALDSPGDDILWNPTNDHVYVYSSYGVITVVDGATNQKLTEIEAPLYMGVLRLSPALNKLYCASYYGNGREICIVDATADTLLKRLTLPGNI